MLVVQKVRELKTLTLRQVVDVYVEIVAVKEVVWTIVAAAAGLAPAVIAVVDDVVLIDKMNNEIWRIMLYVECGSFSCV